MKKETKFIPIQKSEGNKKNKYGIIPQNYNRSCQVAIEHNVLFTVKRDAGKRPFVF